METDKDVFTIFGSKGAGKTTLAFTFKGTKLCFSYDGKSTRIKKYLFNNSPEIIVIDGVEGYERDPDHMVSSSKVAYNNILNRLKEYNGKVDWVIHDCLEVVHEISEQVMRDMFKLKPFAGVPVQSNWKYRRVLLSNLHRKSIQAAKRGVIYTTFVKIEDQEIQDGEIITKSVVPRYFDLIEAETDVLIKMDHKTSKGGDEEFFAKIVTSKLPKYRTGSIVPVKLKVEEK